MQGQRHFIERSFQDSKSHLGLDQYQARNWNSWHHHMALILMAMVFLLQQRLERKKNSSINRFRHGIYFCRRVAFTQKQPGTSDRNS
jgi:SRSO17 transposase